MIPKLIAHPDLPVLYEKYLDALKKEQFLGDIQTDYSSRLATATDNSIYQVVPKVVLFPRSEKDIQKVFLLAAKPEFRTVTFSPRGGGTGTNGQSLTDGIMIDCSRFMNKIKQIDIAKGEVTVEPGVVLDQLNEVVEKEGVFFAPNLSPSNRATIGGMANTDACGKGSRIYGRTSEHIIKLKCLLVNGDVLETKEISFTELDALISNDGKLKEAGAGEGSENIAEIYHKIKTKILDQTEEIEAQFPKLTRFMTGYNLAKVIDQKNKTFNLNYLIAGSEGTLVYVTELTLKLTPLPKQKMLFAIQYASFDAALRDGRTLLKFDPAALETIDDNILKLAEHDEIYSKVSHMLKAKEGAFPEGINLLEFTAETLQDFDYLKVTDFLQKAEKEHKILGFYCALKDKDISALWDLRKKGVGLLGAMKGTRKPIPFMEDTAVPPECLADYIVELRHLLDGYGLKYGMFGHVDVGCLHMRPALDINTEEDRQLVVTLTKKVNALVKKYHGVYWSEHGKGFRSEYIIDYFGDQLYQTLREVKGMFDPHNQLNPGKIVVPDGSSDSVVKVDGPFKGYQDMQVNPEIRHEYAGAFNCNGNAACLNYNLDSTMCPSAKVSRDWVHSPKGRSSLLREWLRQLSAEGYDIQNDLKTNWIMGITAKISQLWKSPEKDFSHEVYQSLAKCLGCKACATACPIKVDIPKMKPKFLAHYHTRYARSLRDYIFATSEESAYLQSKAPSVSSTLMGLKSVQVCVEGLFKIKDLPVPSSIKLDQALILRGAPVFNLDAMKDLSPEQKKKIVCLVQDAFTSVYETEVILATYDLLVKLGYTVYVLPFRVNGKAYHAKGFLQKFNKIALKNTNFYNQISELDVPLIGLEPSLVLCYRDEYVEALGKQVQFKVAQVQEWLSTQLENIEVSAIQTGKSFSLYAHCTERALAGHTILSWQKIFKAFGHQLKVVNVGCCGMAGTFGHEKENYQDSIDIYALSWKDKVSKEKIDSEVLVTGFSCRSQIKRLEGQKAQHPISALCKGVI